VSALFRVGFRSLDSRDCSIVEVASRNDSDKVPASGDAMATKQAAKKRAKKAPAKKRASKAPAKKRAGQGSTKKRARKTPAKKRTTKATAKARTSKAPAEQRWSSPVPAKPESTYAAPGAVSPVVPPPQPAPPPPPSRVASYLESVPQDRAELVSGLLQVARGTAKDLRTLFTQALALSHKKTDHYDR
jgi:hypothetical protein